MSRFRKKPVVIEAVQYLGPRSKSLMRDFIDAPIDERGESGLRIKTLEGWMVANVGDWIIKGVAGEFYPCKPDIFDATYEPADTPPVRGERE